MKRMRLSFTFPRIMRDVNAFHLLIILAGYCRTWAKIIIHFIQRVAPYVNPISRPLSSWKSKLDLNENCFQHEWSVKFGARKVRKDPPFRCEKECVLFWQHLPKPRQRFNFRFHTHILDSSSYEVFHNLIFTPIDCTYGFKATLTWTLDLRHFGGKETERTSTSKQTSQHPLWNRCESSVAKITSSVSDKYRKKTCMRP